MFRVLPAALGAAIVLTACGGASQLTGPSPLTGAPGGSVIFLTHSADQNASMSALFEGQIRLDAAGCLRLVSADAGTVIWPKGFTPAGSGGDVVVRDASGRDIGRVGGSFRLGGGFVDSLHAGIPVSSADRQRAAASCPGTYWIVGDVLQP